MRDFVRFLAVLAAVLAVVACGSEIPAIFDVDAGHGGSGGEVETSRGTSTSWSSSSSSGEHNASDMGDSTGSSDGASAGDSTDASSGGDKAVPVEVEVFVSPSPATDVGEVQVSVWTSRPVASIDIFDNGAPLVLGAAPANPVHVFEVTSDDAPGDGTHKISAVAHAADGVSGQDVEDLVIDVQPGGTDVWPPYVKAGPINGFTAAALRGNGIDVAGFFETNQAIEAVAVRIDGTKGQPEGAPILLGPVAVTGGGRGPAIAAAGDAAFVAWTRPDNGSTRWAVSRVVFGEGKGETWTGPLGSSANAIAVAGDVLIVAGAEKAPKEHDLKVWWISAVNGALLHEEKFAASPADDIMNWWDEVARGVAIVAGEIVVVGERQILNLDNILVRRTVVLRYSLDGAPIGDTWTSPGEQMDEDAGLAVAPLRAGGFIVTGWGRNLLEPMRLLLTRWFTAGGDSGPPRIEPTTNDAIGFAVGEDREGKIVIAGAVKQPQTDANAWVFAVPGPMGAPAWEVVRNGPGQGPDEAAGLAVDAWGHAYIVGSEFEALQPRAFALRLYP